MSDRRIPKTANNKRGEYQLLSQFKGYRAREDYTTLPPGFLVSPSKNVVIKTSGRVSSVKGYALDGAGSTAIDSGILSNHDFITAKGNAQNLRAGWLTVAGNDGKLQYRYQTGATVSWIDLKTSLTNVVLSYCNFWDDTEKLSLALWVDGSNNIFEWNGAVTTFASATANTITTQGTATWAQKGFYATRNKSIVINGVTYTYTGGESTTTLTGVSPDPTGAGIAVGAVIHQLPVTNALSGMTGISATFGPTVIGCGRQNQVYVGSSASNDLYVSKTNSLTDYSYTNPGRTAGQGFYTTLKGPPVKFIPQEVTGLTNAYDMYISTGTDRWSVVRSTVTLTATAGLETLDVIELKVAPLQGAKSERLACKMKNHIAFVGCDNVANFIGYMSYQYVPAMVDFSYPIIDDMVSYNMANASIFYHRNYIYVAIPTAGIVRIYNMTDQTQESFTSLKAMEDVTQQPWFWEAPVGYPVSGFYTVNGEIYGHSFTSSESYKLFTGNNFNGQDIDANATFSYDDKGDRTQSKGSNEIWVEGYIQQNTKLNVTVTGDLDAFSTAQTVVVDGSNNNIVAYGGNGGSLGKDPLGDNPLGGGNLSNASRPAWFHVALTYVQEIFYLEQVSFATKGVDLNWEIIAFGTNSTLTVEGNNSITI